MSAERTHRDSALVIRLLLTSTAISGDGGTFTLVVEAAGTGRLLPR